MMIRQLKACFSWLWNMAIFLLILVLTLFVLLRLSLPLLGEYKQEFSEAISEQLGQKITIGEIRPEWKSYMPVLTLRDIHFESEGKTDLALKLSEIYISMDLLASWRNATFVAKRITISGLNFTLQRDKNGLILPFTLPNDTHQPMHSKLHLPNVFYLEDSLIYIEQANVDIPIRLSQVQGELVSLNGHYQLTLDWLVSGGKAEFKADFHGNSSNLSQSTGEMYLKASHVDVGSLLRWQQTNSVQLKKGVGNFEIWAGWSLEGLSYAQGNIQLKNALVISQSETSEKRLLELDQLESHINWQQTESGWQLHLADLSVQRRAGVPFSTELVLQQSTQGHQHTLRLNVEQLPLDEVAIYTRLIPAVPTHINRQVALMNPHADLRELEFVLTETDGESIWLAKGQVKGLSSQPTGDLPGVDKMDIAFELSENQGMMRLNGEDASLDIQGLFRQPLEFFQLKGQLRWHQEASGDWLLWTDAIQASNSDITTNTRFSFHLPQEGKMKLELRTDFERGDGSKLSRYLPAIIMPEGAVSWLENSIKQGYVPNGYAEFSGALSDFPFTDPDAGHFITKFTVDDLTLDYWQGWPAMEKVSAEVEFNNLSFSATVSKGQLYDAHIMNVEARIDDLMKTSPLKLKGLIQGDLSNYLRLLKESPLKDDFLTLAKQMKSKGKADLSLQVSIPIDTDDLFQLNGTLDFKQSQLNLLEHGVILNGLKGKLHFSDSGVKAPSLNASIDGTPVTLSLLSNKKNKGTHISLKGNLSIKQLQKRLPHLDLSRLSGAALMQVHLKLPPLDKKNAPIDLELLSDLQGVSIDLPAPLGKLLETQQPLRLKTLIGRKPERLLTLRYGDRLAAVIKLTQIASGDLKPLKGEIRIGGGQARLPDTLGLRIYGRLDQLDITPWLALAPNSDEPSELDIRLIDVGVKQLTWSEKTINDLTLLFRKAPTAWHFRVNSDLLRGTLIYPHDITTGAATIKLDYLVLDTNQHNDDLVDANTDTKPLRSINPLSLPRFDINIEDLVINKQRFGHFEAKTQRLKTGQKISRATIKSDLLTLIGSGFWLNTLDGQTTSLDLNLHSSDFGSLLVGFGFEQKIKDASANFLAKLNWSGGIHQFDIKQLSGDISLEMTRGRFVDVNPGLGRLLGLLNISELQRRLTLDFSELGKGFVFTSIDGHFDITQGKAVTHNLKVEGSVARLDVMGEVDLGKKWLNQQMIVTAHVSSALPLAATIAGGPAVGAIVLLAQSIIGDEVDAVAQQMYQVTGDWSEPTIVKIKSNANSKVNEIKQADTLNQASINQSPQIPPKTTEQLKKRAKKPHDSPLKRLIEQFGEAPNSNFEDDYVDEFSDY